MVLTQSTPSHHYLLFLEYESTGSVLTLSHPARCQSRQHYCLLVLVLILVVLIVLIVLIIKIMILLIYVGLVIV